MDNEAKTKPVTHWNSIARGQANIPRRFKLCFLVTLLMVYPRFSYGQTAVITGGADVSGHNYSWQVRNSGAQPIVEIRFPHFRTGLFFPPSGWSSDCTSPMQVGATGEPGVCTTRATASGDAISPGRSLAFSMRITSGGVKRGPGEVTVRFADGSETRVAGVELPQPEAAGDKNLPLLGLGGVFAILLIVQAVRNRRRRARLDDEGPAAGTESR